VARRFTFYFPTRTLVLVFGEVALGPNGKLDKTLVADLLNLANPRGVGGFGDPFTFPFTTIEDVVILDDRTLGVLNDNNFPFSSGRTPGKPDNDEFITIRLSDNLHADPRVLLRR